MINDEQELQKGAGPTNTTSPEPKQMLLAGERAMKMPTIPKAQAGQDFCTAQEYKIFMQDAHWQDWANLQSKEYGQLVQDIYKDPVSARVDNMIALMNPTGIRMDTVRHS